jgi:pimeloyl-ACP methyl ester carboxylesterase
MTRSRALSATLALLFGVVTLGSSSAAAATAVNERNQLHCSRSSLPVTLAAQETTTYQVVGWLCARGRAQGKTVQVLVSGLTYDHTYWDLPYRPNTYSYVRAATDAGYATFNLDRIGVGESDRPSADRVTVATEAYVTSEIVQALRRGEVGGTSFKKIIGVGHSLGAAMWMYATKAEVDGLILIGYLHQPNVPQQVAIGASLYAAPSDARFSTATMPAGYLTTRPGTRAGDFYNTGYLDQAVLALDEKLKQTTTSGERATLNLARDPQYSRAIRVPVLLAVGQQDALACSVAAGLSCTNSEAIRNREQPYYSPQTCLSISLIARAGHSSNLHLNAHQWSDTALQWANYRVGNTAHTQPIKRCQA